MKLSHRIASPEDLPEIVSIYNSTIASRMATADTEPVTVASRLAWFEAHVPESRPLWVAEHAGAVVGWLSFSSFYGRPAYSRTAELGVYVNPGSRRRGVGRYLIDQAVTHAPVIAIDTLLAFVFRHNSASLGLFGSLGFASWGLLPGVAVMDGVERDLVILGRRVR
ncbi:MAG: N-acetyltransferase [Chromatiales bacterium]|nr:N-acetyltransferase [Chromatiales bacterium]